MKKIFLILVFVSSKVLFCPGEGAAYIGMHLGRDVATEAQERAQQAKQESKSLKERFRDMRDSAVARGKELVARGRNFFNKDTSSPSPVAPDELIMDEGFDDRPEVNPQHEEMILDEERQKEAESNIKKKKTVTFADDIPSKATFTPSDVDTWDLNRLKNITPKNISDLSVEQVTKLLNKPDYLKRLSQLQIRAINPEMFAKALTEKTLSFILNNPKILTKLTDEQVRALNPEMLSKVVQNKLSKPLDFAFAQKLSWAQIRQLLADHTGLRWKNWFTDFKKNVTPEALQYMKSKEFDPHSERKFKTTIGEDNYLKVQLQKLPESKRPANILVAEQYMQEGEVLWNSLKSGNLWDYENENNILNTIFKEMPDITPEQIDKLSKIFDGTLRPDPNDPAFKQFMKLYQTVIIKLQWYFYKLSILEDGRAFEGGAVTFKDSQGFLFNFLENYARLLNPDYQSFSKSWNTKAYKRLSSHFRGQFTGKNIGIDIQVAPGELGLPLNYPHLLFDQRKNGYIFAKWEPYGMGTIGDVIAHGASFLATRGENDESKHTKDRIAKDVQNEFWKLYTGPKTINIKKQVSSEGISRMLTLLDGSAKTKFEQYLTQDRARNTALRNYQASSLQARRGGESIIDPN